MAASSPRTGSPRPQPRAVLVVNPATGFPQTFYFRLANYAAGRGYDTLVYDYRGMGASAPAHLANETCRMSDWGLLDMRTALAAVAERAAGLPVATLGHSVGGQFLGLLTNHSLATRARADRDLGGLLAVGAGAVQVPGVVVLARAWSADARDQGLRSHRRWLGGLPLPRGVFEEWRRWCLRPDHFGPDLAHLSRRQCICGDPRSGAQRGIQRRSHRHAPHRGRAQQVLSRTCARIALVHAGGRRAAPASATKDFLPRAIATPCGAR